jgi:hypothetical protein
MNPVLCKPLIWLLWISTFLCAPAVSGQKVAVSDPKLELRGNTIHITYDILNSTPSEEFTVELLVKDADGKQIHASALSGDIGDLVTGGSDKHIDWDLDVDRIEMNANIYVNIYLKAVEGLEPIVRESVTEKIEEEDPSGFSQVKDQGNGKQYNRTTLILQSAAFPGLGLSRYKGGVHWIKGVAAYGCIGGSVIMNRKAINTFAGINDLTDFDEKDALYQQSLIQDNFSEALVYTAIAIWITDLVWTFTGTSDLKHTSLNQKGIRINPTIDPVSNAPLIAFTYNF